MSTRPMSGRWRGDIVRRGGLELEAELPGDRPGDGLAVAGQQM